MALSLTLMLGVAPLWISLQSEAVAAQESAIAHGAWRVASARLERDLRGATTDGATGLGPNPLLQAGTTEVVFVTRDPRTGTLEIVEWEVAGSSLMRRRRPWPGQLPSGLSHGAFSDHKTMLEGVSSGSFMLLSGDSTVAGATYPQKAPAVDLVRFEATINGGSSEGRHRLGVAGEMSFGW